MAKDLQKYTSGTILVNGVLMAEAVEFSVSKDYAKQEVNTLHKGLAGYSKGTVKVDITIKAAIPRSGFELDFEQLADDDQEIEITVLSASKTRTYKCEIMSVGENYQVNQSSNLDVKCMGIMVAS